MAEYSFIGKGKVYGRVKGDASKLYPFGNVSDLTAAVEEDEKSLQNFQSAGGGKLNSIRRIQAVTINMTMTDFNAANIALALFGDVAAIAGGSVTDESVIGYKDSLVRLANIAPTNVVVDNDPATTPYTEISDYEVTNAGIYIPLTSSIVDSAALLIDYDFGDQNVVQALMNSASELELVFDGLNEAQSGKAVVVDMHRVKFGATGGLPMIGDDFGNLPLSGELLADTSKGSNLSQYMVWNAIEA